MAITAQIDNAQRIASISINGKFTYLQKSEFLNAIKPLNTESHIRQVQIDLSQTDYMDCGAIGMLLQLRQNLCLNESELLLSGVNDSVRRFLEVSKFEKLCTLL